VTLGKQKPAVLTPIKLADLWNELLLQWELFGDLNRGAIELLLVHVAAEVSIDTQKGTLPICYNYNIGNKRPANGQDYCLFGCGEELRLAKAEQLLAENPETVSIALRYVKQTKLADGTTIAVSMASVKFKPPHPFCQFRSYDSLKDSAKSLIKHVNNYRNCWHALLSEQPELYVRELKAISYMTASESSYLALVRTRLLQVKRITDKYDWGDVS